ncbi:MAG: TetR/AcrR family transcriptional regulator [Thermoleophilaceae bacterium]|nr:TetR/AcrR family transcriptional regulator [Thermoleophilaceae bacterium]
MTSAGPDAQGRRVRRLPSGRHGLSRRFVARNQRERLLAAVAQAVSQRGYARATVSDITRIAGVSTRTFYDHFDNKHDCFLASYDEIVSRLGGAVAQAYERESGWEHKIRAGVQAFIEFVLAEPHFAVACLVEAPAAGPELRSRRDSAIRFFSGFFEPGRTRPGRAATLPPLGVELVIGGLYEIIHLRLQRGTPEQLRDDLPDMVYCALLPFSDHAAAAEAAYGTRPAGGGPPTEPAARATG